MITAYISCLVTSSVSHSSLLLILPFCVESCGFQWRDLRAHLGACVPERFSKVKLYLMDFGESINIARKNNGGKHSSSVVQAFQVSTFSYNSFYCEDNPLYHRKPIASRSPNTILSTKGSSSRNKLVLSYERDCLTISNNTAFLIAPLLNSLYSLSHKKHSFKSI